MEGTDGIAGNLENCWDWKRKPRQNSEKHLKAGL